MNSAVALPVDVKLMNIASAVLFSLFAVLLAAAGVWWVLRNPVFAIAGITVQGDVTHNSALTLRANVAPQLAGNFFTINLDKARAAFEAVPWVRHAVVRREFPNRLRVQLEEHKAAAYWGAEGEDKLVNGFGEVFQANAGDVENEELPRLVGPVERAGEVLDMYRTLKPMVEPLDMALEELVLTTRGSWEMTLDNGGIVELGRGTKPEVLARTQRFVQTITQVTSRYSRRPESLVSADLRHADGYAVRLRGVNTTETPVKK
jgi:cell division protein FtsQ